MRQLLVIYIWSWFYWNAVNVWGKFSHSLGSNLSPSICGACFKMCDNSIGHSVMLITAMPENRSRLVQIDCLLVQSFTYRSRIVAYCICLVTGSYLEYDDVRRIKLRQGEGQIIVPFSKTSLSEFRRLYGYTTCFPALQSDKLNFQRTF